jgi:tRNA uridine 5-carbamoylmethylation protein Kti12
MKICISKGSLIAYVNVDNNYLSKVPMQYMDNQKKRDNNKHHITIIFNKECNLEDLNKQYVYKKEIDDEKLFNFGLGKINKGTNEVYYLVVYCEYFNRIRKNYNLNSQSIYHITVGFKFNDIHSANKGLDTLIYKNPYVNKGLAHKINNIDILQYIEKEYNYKDDKLFILYLKNKVNEIDCQHLIDNKNYIGYICLYYLKKDMNIISNAYKYYDKDIHNKYDSKNNFLNYMLKVHNDYQMNNSNEKRKYLMFLYYDELVIHEMPRNFSWLIPNKIGGISALRNEKDILGVKQLGISTIYYFLEERYFDKIDNHGVSINYIHCKNTYPPTIKDITRVIEGETYNEPILYGCLGGYGRTGCALGCYLCKYGLDRLDGQGMSSEQAITCLRNIRPKSIESNEQMNFIKKYSNSLYNSLFGVQVNKVKTSIKLIILVGLPGAGKTTFTDLFLTSGIDIGVISQDTMGRKICENTFLETIKNYDMVILDRTNITKEDRQSWLKLSMLTQKQVLCIYLSTPLFVCTHRAKNRENHPTIRKGGGERIIKDLASRIEIPNKNEGFHNVIVLEDEEDVRNYLKTWNCSKISIESTDDGNYINKFPRTQHLINLGGATRDDLIVSHENYKLYFSNNVDICEKVDGAQLGFSIDNNYNIKAQNRSHYVNSKYHSQFKLLDKWIAKHKSDLINILDENLILFGEWLYAIHSIEYSSLPDYFLAFDLYNKKEKLFYSRSELEKKLKDTTILPVKLLYNGNVKDEKQLLRMLELESEYSQHTKVEGIYLKVNEGKYIKHRAKIVRKDFLSGNKHWSKRIIRINKLKI